ncbi:MAG TPA: hypothetical protein VK927_04765, partial [Adhaeribacter sp.]|nr:hypothetical protein [Adhaeribacter sp.]
EGVAIAIATGLNELNQEIWNVFLINNNPYPLENVLVASKGYGQLNGQEVKTSVLRHMFEVVEPKSAVKVEPIDPAIFQITNEFWVSYYIGSKIFDKKYLFVPGSVVPEHLVDIALLNARGVLHF